MISEWQFEIFYTMLTNMGNVVVDLKRWQWSFIWTSRRHSIRWIMRPFWRIWITMVWWGPSSRGGSSRFMSYFTDRSQVVQIDVAVYEMQGVKVPKDPLWDSSYSRNEIIWNMSINSLLWDDTDLVHSGNSIRASLTHDHSSVAERLMSWQTSTFVMT